jgi:hypothetical protein
MSALLQVKNLLHQKHTKPFSSQWLQQATSATDTLLKELLLALMHIHDKRSQVHLCQRTLQALYHQAANIPHSGEARQKISSSIKFIRDQLPEYFNWEEKAIITGTATKQITKFLLTTYHLQPLSRSIYNVLALFVQHEQLTWRHYEFIKQLQKTPLVADNILIHLLQFNIVDSPILTTIIEYWQQQITHAEDPLNHIRSLMQQLNTCHSMPPLFNPIPLYDKLSGWLQDEYTFLSQTDGKPISNQVPTQQAVLGSPLFTNLSVAQLAAFTRIVVEAGIISCNNQKQLFATLASNIRTAGTSAISPQSFRNKYYVPEASTISAVKDLCIRMLNEARKLA